jgi:hypothetical protein
MPDLNYLKSILDYDLDTGVFTYKINGNNQFIKIGQIAGYLWIDPKRHGVKYYRIKIDGKTYMLYRIAYFYVTGIDPAEKEIDHKDGNTLNNKFENLRLATRFDNTKNCRKYKNNTSGFKGVSWHRKKWNARIAVNNKRINLGCYNNKFYAALVYARAAKQYFGDWRRVI